MEVHVLSGSAHPALGEAVARELGARGGLKTARFPDGEVEVVVTTPVQGGDVYVVQPTGPSVDEHLFELALIGDAARRAGAARLTAVVPYFGYARHDRRARPGQPLAARLAAELLASGGYQRVVTVDLHAEALESAFSMPLENVTAMPLLAHALTGSREAVVVGPDLGAGKLATKFAAHLGLPVALVHKERRSGSEVAARHVFGDVRGKRPIVVDDMVSTGGTVVAAVTALLEAGCRPEITLVASHGLFVGEARAKLDALPIRRIVITDSLPQKPWPGRDVETVSLAPMLAEAVRKLAA